MYGFSAVYENSNRHQDVWNSWQRSAFHTVHEPLKQFSFLEMLCNGYENIPPKKELCFKILELGADGNERNESVFFTGTSGVCKLGRQCNFLRHISSWRIMQEKYEER